jgi:hypothetical protein
LKKIELISASRTGKYYPRRPRKNTYQTILDVSLLLEIPQNGPSESDLKKTVDETVLSTNDSFFSSQRYALRTQINYFLGGKRDVFKIIFICEDGLVRSRVAADYFKDWISSFYQASLSISVRHTELELNNKEWKKFSIAQCYRRTLKFFQRKYAFCKTKSIIFYQKILIQLKSSAINANP